MVKRTLTYRRKRRGYRKMYRRRMYRRKRIMKRTRYDGGTSRKVNYSVKLTHSTANGGAYLIVPFCCAYPGGDSHTCEWDQSSEYTDFKGAYKFWKCTGVSVSIHPVRNYTAAGTSVTEDWTGPWHTFMDRYALPANNLTVETIMGQDDYSHYDSGRVFKKFYNIGKINKYKIEGEGQRYDSWLETVNDVIYPDSGAIFKAQTNGKADGDTVAIALISYYMKFKTYA